MRHAHALQRLHHPPLAIRSRHSLAVRQRQLNIFVDREIANQIETLEDESDLLIANPRALRKVQILDRLSIQRIAAACRRIQQPDDRQQRRFAASRRSRHSDILPFTDRQMNAGERVRLDLISVEDFRQILDLDEWLPRSVMLVSFAV